MRCGQDSPFRVGLSVHDPLPTHPIRILTTPSQLHLESSDMTVGALMNEVAPENLWIGWTAALLFELNVVSDDAALSSSPAHSLRTCVLAPMTPTTNRTAGHTGLHDCRAE